VQFDAAYAPMFAASREQAVGDLLEHAIYNVEELVSVVRADNDELAGASASRIIELINDSDRLAAGWLSIEML
jgi:hypothetical protein